MNNQIVVVAGIISYKNQLLIVQRSLASTDLQPGLWEFPGGKVKHGENPEQALKREITEELALSIENLRIYEVTSGMFDQLHAIMLIYTCQTQFKEVQLYVGNDYTWISPYQLSEYQFAKLDIPVVSRMISELPE